MPIFEFVCQECDTKYEKLVRNGEKISCPKCGSAKRVQQLSVFSASASGGSKTESAPSGGFCPSTGNPCACSN